jgi:chemotaxis protein MotB
MKIIHFLPLALIVAAVSQGCVSTKQYAELQASYNKSIDTNRNLKQSWQVTQQELAGARSRVQSLEEQIASAKNDRAALQDALNKCLAGNNQGGMNISKLVDQINASDKYIQHLVNVNLKMPIKNKTITCLF